MLYTPELRVLPFFFLFLQSSYHGLYTYYILFPFQS